MEQPEKTDGSIQEARIQTEGCVAEGVEEELEDIESNKAKAGAVPKGTIFAIEEEPIKQQDDESETQSQEIVQTFVQNRENSQKNVQNSVIESFTEKPDCDTETCQLNHESPLYISVENENMKTLPNSNENDLVPSASHSKSKGMYSDISQIDDIELFQPVTTEVFANPKAETLIPLIGIGRKIWTEWIGRNFESTIDDSQIETLTENIAEDINKVERSSKVNIDEKKETSTPTFDNISSVRQTQTSETNLALKKQTDPKQEQDNYLYGSAKVIGDGKDTCRSKCDTTFLMKQKNRSEENGELKLQKHTKHLSESDGKDKSGRSKQTNIVQTDTSEKNSILKSQNGTKEGHENQSPQSTKAIGDGKSTCRSKYHGLKPENEFQIRQINASEKALSQPLHSLTKQKQKITVLVLEIDKKISHADDLQHFLSTKVQKNTYFEVMKCWLEKEKTITHLQFQSKNIALRFKNEINRNQRKEGTRIRVFDEKYTSAIERCKNNDKIFTKNVEEILHRAEANLYGHEQKLNDTRKLFQERNKNMKKEKFMQEDVFRVLDVERKALEDQVKELELHRKEFKIYLEKITQRLEMIKEDPDLESHISKIRKDFGIECLKLRDALPIYARRSDILSVVKENQVSVILGETGSGKSTQLPQYIYHEGLAYNGLIACTQPRKVAAVSLATRVASEMASTVGNIVGYQVGMKTNKTSATKILYMTDHILLNSCLQDNDLSEFSCIIIDEAHERSIYTDLLLGMIKRCLSKRKDLRVIITSATIDPGIFVQYFNDCPVLKVSGRNFPVEIVWEDEKPGKHSFENYERSAVGKALEIHQNEPAGDILVFLTSPSEAENCCELVQKQIRDRNDIICLQLHGKIQIQEQRRIFNETPRGKRKIVFATNSAETSITIPNIKYVVDTGLVKEMEFDPLRNLNTLNVTMITKSSAEQRRGRAGRTVAGKCFRLYTENDFDQMKPNNVPELLRINLGQAILKLFELGVNPLEFEFVQPPNRQSMKSSFELLQQIGAIDENLITDIGRWIAKLPIDPKFGAFVHDAVTKGLGFEAIVISACMPVGNSIFFRGGTQSEKEMADRIKVKFCHEGGDFLTYLNVYRDWYQVSEKSKGKWCFDNRINGKVIKGVRDTVNEILFVIKKELGETIKCKFSDDTCSQNMLPKLLVKTLKSNISHFLGHNDAGYLYVEKDQQVHLHPSCSVLALGQCPAWIVFLKVLRTSRDYAMDIVQISDELLLEGIKEGWLTVDLEEAKLRKIYPVHTAEVGSQLFWEFVGPRYTKLRNLESDFQDILEGNLGVIEADKNKGEIKMYAADIFSTHARDLLTKALEPLQEKLRTDESEQQLSQHTDTVRALMGPGASVVTLFMPHEFKTVEIHCSSRLVHHVTADMIKRHFESYGRIHNYWHRKIDKNIKPMNFLGKLTFDKVESAASAITGTEQEVEIQARSSVRNAGNAQVGFRAVLSWCRRPSKGFGYIGLRHYEDISRALRKGHVLIGGSIARIQLAKNDDKTLYITNLGKIVNEDVLCEGIANLLRIDPDNDIEKVVIVREKIDTTKDDLQQYGRRIKGLISQFVRKGSFEVDLKSPPPQAHNYMAFVTFSDPDEGLKACREVRYSSTINGEVLSMKADLNTSIYVQKHIYEKIVDDIDDCIQNDQATVNVNMRTKKLKSGNYVVDLHANSTEDLAMSKRAIHKIVRGEKIVCEQDQRKSCLFYRSGRERLQSIMHQTNTVISIDNRVMEITIYGKCQNRDRAKAKIDQYLVEMERLGVKQIELKGEGKPPGVMKAVFIKYGVSLKSLLKEAKLANIELDHRHHKLKFTGTEQALNDGFLLINEIIDKLSSGSNVTEMTGNPDCVVCQTSVEYDEIYRLESCGHAYHKECIELQITSAISGKDFPLCCCLETCESQFAWKDIENLARFGFITLSNLVSSSVSSFVAKHNDLYRYCITPDCPVVYRISKKGTCFQCPDCEIRICTNCHIQFHDGLTCKMYQSSKNDGGLSIWLRRDPENRKLCPSCDAPIEKNGGCNHMECASCRMHICWVCSQVFKRCGECYAHLAKVHGSFA